MVSKICFYFVVLLTSPSIADRWKAKSEGAIILMYFCQDSIAFEQTIECFLSFTIGQKAEEQTTKKFSHKNEQRREKDREARRKRRKNKKVDAFKFTCL